MMTTDTNPITHASTVTRTISSIGVTISLEYIGTDDMGGKNKHPDPTVILSFAKFEDSGSMRDDIASEFIYDIDEIAYDQSLWGFNTNGITDMDLTLLVNEFVKNLTDLQVITSDDDSLQHIIARLKIVDQDESEG